MADNSNITGSTDTSVDVSKVGTLNVKSDVNVNITSKGTEGTPSISAVEKKGSSKKESSPKKSSKSSATANQIEILKQISETLSNLNDAAQNISNELVGQGAKTEEPKKAKGGGKDSGNKLLEQLGQPGFRTNFKDALVLGLSEWMKDSEVQEIMKSSLSSDAEEAAETPITRTETTTNSDGETETKTIGGSEAVEGSISSETNASIADVGEVLESATESSQDSAAIVESTEKVGEVTETVVDQKVNSAASSSTGNAEVDGTNASVKEQNDNIKSEEAATSQVTDKLDEAAKETVSESKAGSEEADKIYKVALVEINNDAILGDKDIKTIIADNIKFQEKMADENASKNGGDDGKESTRLDAIAESVASMNETSQESLTAQTESARSIIDNAKESQENLGKKLESSLPKEEKGAAKGEGLLAKFEGILSKKYSSVSPKTKEKIKKVASAGIKAGGKIMQYAGKATKIAGSGLKGAGKVVSGGGKLLGGAVSMGANALGGIIGLIPKLKGAGEAIAGAGNAAGEAIKTGSKTAGDAMGLAGDAAKDAGGQLAKTGKEVAKNSDKIAGEALGKLDKKPQSISKNPGKGGEAAALDKKAESIKGGGKGEDPKLSVLKQIFTVLTGMLALNKKNSADAAKDRMFQKQFGSMKGGTKAGKGGKFDFSSITKAIAKTMKDLPEMLASGLMKAKMKSIMMIIGIIVAIGLLIWGLLSNPGLAKKIGEKIKQFFSWLWKTIQAWCKKASNKAIIIASILLGLVMMWAFPIGWLAGLAIMAVAAIAGLAIKYWDKIKALWKKWYPLILGLLVAIALFHIMGPWGLLVGAIVMIGALIFKFKDKIWAGIKKVWKILKNVIMWPFKKLAALGKKIKDAIFGLLSKIPFVGKFFKKSGGEGKEEKEAEEKAEEEKSEDEEKLKPDEKSTSIVNNNNTSNSSSSSSSYSNSSSSSSNESNDFGGNSNSGGGGGGGGESPEEKKERQEFYKNIDSIKKSMNLNFLRTAKIIVSSGMLTRKTIMISSGLKLFKKKQKHPLKDILDNANQVLFDINGNVKKISENKQQQPAGGFSIFSKIKGGLFSKFKQLKDFSINKLKQFKNSSFKDKLKTVGKIAGVGALAMSGPVGWLAGAGLFGASKLFKKKNKVEDVKSDISNNTPTPPKSELSDKEIILKWKDKPDSAERTAALKSAGVDFPNDLDDIKDRLKEIDMKEKAALSKNTNIEKPIEKIDNEVKQLEAEAANSGISTPNLIKNTNELDENIKAESASSGIKPSASLVQHESNISNIENSTSNSTSSSEVKQSDNNYEGILNSLPKAFSIALADYFDNHALKLNSKQHESLEIVSSDRNDEI